MRLEHTLENCIMILVKFLGPGATMIELRRTRVDQFNEDNLVNYMN